MPLRLKIIFVVSCLWTALSCAADNYESNPSAQVVIDELVAEEDFDREQLMAIFAQAERKDSILKAMPAQRRRPSPGMNTGLSFLTIRAKTKEWSFLIDTVWS